MGIYIDKGNNAFREIRNSEYVDKSGLIAVVNKTLRTEQKFSCVTRSRRFGKSMAAKMLAAYYDRSCNSHSLFADLAIASDPTFEQNLNKYPVFSVDMSDFVTRFKNRDIVKLMDAELRKDIAATFPDVPTEDDDDLMALLIRANSIQAQGKKSVDSPHTPNQNILAQRNSCLKKILPLHHGKETNNGLG